MTVSRIVPCRFLNCWSNICELLWTQVISLCRYLCNDLHSLVIKFFFHSLTGFQKFPCLYVDFCPCFHQILKGDSLMKIKVAINLITGNGQFWLSTITESYLRSSLEISELDKWGNRTRTLLLSCYQDLTTIMKFLAITATGFFCLLFKKLDHSFINASWTPRKTEVEVGLYRAYCSLVIK